MPTPTGLLKAGDRVRHKPTGTVCRVVAREGSDATYSVILKPEDGYLPTGVREAYGHPGCFRLTEAAYWLTQTYEVLK